MCQLEYQINIDDTHHLNDLGFEFCIKYCVKYSFVDIHLYSDKEKEFNHSISSKYFIFIPNTNQYLT